MNTRVAWAAVALLALALLTGADSCSTSDSGGSDDSGGSGSAARITVVKSKSFCRTDPSTAYLYVYVTLRNRGSEAGEIDLRPWRRYSDGSVNDSVVDVFTVKVGAYATKKTYARFGYNPQEHELLACGVYTGDNVVPTRISVVQF
jgi:hypothetical protein